MPKKVKIDVEQYPSGSWVADADFNSIENITEESYRGYIDVEIHAPTEAQVRSAAEAAIKALGYEVENPQ